MGRIQMNQTNVRSDSVIVKYQNMVFEIVIEGNKDDFDIMEAYIRSDVSPMLTFPERQELREIISATLESEEDQRNAP
jgi:hypothetical protein